MPVGECDSFEKSTLAEVEQTHGDQNGGSKSASRALDAAAGAAHAAAGGVVNGGGHANGDSVSESEGGTHRPAGNGSQSDAGAQPEPQGSAGNEGAEKKISLGGIIKAAQATVSDSLPPTLSQPLVDRNSFQEKMEGMAATTLHNRVPIQRSTSEREVGMSAVVGGLMRAKMIGAKQKKRLVSQTSSKEKAEAILKSLDADIKVHRGHNTRQRTKDVMDARNASLPFFIFHPYSTWRLGWDVLITFFLFYSLISVPVMLSFDRPSGCSPDFLGQRGIWYFDFCMDCMFICDMLLNLRTGYFEANKVSNEPVLVTSGLKIAEQYAKGFLWIDLVSSIPFDLLLLSVCNGNSSDGQSALLRSPKVLKLIRLVRVLRLLRISRLKKFFSKIRDLLRINPGVLRLVQFLVAVMLLAHYNGCFFFFISEFNAHDQSQSDATDSVDDWTRIGKQVASDNGKLLNTYEMEIWEQYLVSLYWATTTLTTTGFGDITPLSTPTMLWCMIVLVEGGFVFSYMVGNMAGLINRIDPRTTRHREKMQIWDAFMYSESLPLEMRQRIRKFANKLHASPLSKLPEFAREQLSKTLLRDITAHTFKKALHSVPMFKGLDEQCLTELALALQPVQIAPGEFIYREGDDGDSMFFLHSGNVELSLLLMTEKEKERNGVRIAANTVESDILLRNKRDGPAPMWQWVGKNKVVLRLFTWHISEKSSSMCFGENVLLTENAKRLATAVASSWCMVFRLDKEALKMVARKFPQMEKVYKQMKRKKASKLMRSVHKVIQAQQRQYKDMAKLFVHLEAAINLPRMDGFMGSCDAYCTIQMGKAEKKGKLYTSTVQYTSLNPVWQETFMFPVRQQSRDKKIELSCTMFDFDVIGDNEEVGEWTVDASNVLWNAIDAQGEATESHWYTLTRVSGGSEDAVPLVVKGHNKKLAKVKISMRAVYTAPIKPKEHKKSSSKKIIQYSSFMVGMAASVISGNGQGPGRHNRIGYLSVNNLSTPINTALSNDNRSKNSEVLTPLLGNGTAVHVAGGKKQPNGSSEAPVLEPAMHRRSPSRECLIMESTAEEESELTVVESPEVVHGEELDAEDLAIFRSASLLKGRCIDNEIQDMSDDQALLLQALADLSGTSLMPFLDGKAMDVESACFQDIGLTPPDKRVLDDTNWRLLFFSLLRASHRERVQADDEMLAMKQMLNQCQDQLRKVGLVPAAGQAIKPEIKFVDGDDLMLSPMSRNTSSEGLLVNSAAGNMSVPVSVSDYTTTGSHSTLSSDLSSKNLTAFENVPGSMRGAITDDALSVRRNLPYGILPGAADEVFDELVASVSWTLPGIVESPAGASTAFTLNVDAAINAGKDAGNVDDVDVAMKSCRASLT